MIRGRELFPRFERRLGGAQEEKSIAWTSQHEDRRREILQRDKNITAERFHRAAKQRVSSDRSVDECTTALLPLARGKGYTYGSGNRLGKHVG